MRVWGGQRRLRRGRSKPNLGRDGLMVAAFRERVLRPWCRTLRRRSNRHRVAGARMYRLAGRWLPNPRIPHPYPAERLGVIT
jgi:RNA-directed DNA polymerase